MSFAEYLKGRISEDYKNLIIQKLEEIKSRTDQLKNTLSPSLQEIQQSFKTALQQELERIQQTLESEIGKSQEQINTEINSMLEEHIASWYYSDISEFEQQQQILISDIVSNVPPPPKKMNADLESLCRLLNHLDQGNTQAEILNILLQQIAEWVDRAVLLVVRGDQASGWAALGLGSDWDASRVRQIRVDLNKDTILRHMIQTGSSVYGSADQYSDNSELFLMIGSTFPQSTLACPVIVRGKIAGILYADVEEELSERPDLANLLYLACRSAGSAIDLLPLKPKGIAQSTVPPATVSAPRPAMAPSMPVQPSVLPSSPPEVEVARETGVEEEPEVVEEVEESEEPEAETIEEEEVAEAIEEEHTDTSQPEPSTVMMPAPKLAAEPLILSDEEKKQHDDAKRFARLLVSEIKLYNEAQVSAGREHKDLYDRLKDDIERSRMTYMERFAHIQSSTNYFYEELVRTLANGDPSLLGM